jgi:hypothetical protein
LGFDLGKDPGMTTLITPLSTSLSAPVRAGASSRLARLGSAIWRALEATGRARVRRQLLDFADRCESNQPELAKELRAASNAVSMG